MKKELRQEIELKLYRYDQHKGGQWNSIISQQIKDMPQQERQLLYMRYIEKKSEREICNELHIERSTYYNWVNSIINDLAIAAAYERLIEP